MPGLGLLGSEGRWSLVRIMEINNGVAKVKTINKCVAATSLSKQEIIDLIKQEHENVVVHNIRDNRVLIRFNGCPLLPLSRNLDMSI